MPDTAGVAVVKTWILSEFSNQESSKVSWRELVKQVAEKDSDTQLGEYFVIQFKPELSGEIINIGVCLIDSKNDFYLKTIQDFTILNQIWKNFEEQVEQVIEAAKEVFMKEGYPNSPSPQLIYTRLKTARFKTVKKCVDALYRDFITHDPSIKG